MTLTRWDLVLIIMPEQQRHACAGGIIIDSLSQALDETTVQFILPKGSRTRRKRPQIRR
ncbi:MAG TPA: hypothetical protein VK192_10555 [Sphingomicrobium sp.]|nr:hypothetical protein [Sphingomicrobium sp.]